MKEPQKIHIAHAAATESANRSISLSTVFTTSWRFFCLYQHDYYIPELRQSDKEQPRDSDSDRHLGGDSEPHSMCQSR